MSDEIATTGAKVFELFVACAGAPDDEATGRAADEALRRLEELLEAQAGAQRPAAG